MQKELLKQNFDVLGLKIPANQCSTFRAKLDGYLLSKPRLRCIVDDKDNPKSKLILLDESIKELKQLPEDMQEFIEAQDAELTTHTITIDHTHLTADQILRKLLPPNIDIPSSFETIGHIAHLNLREEQFPYKKAIAEVILDKNPRIKTVVNKVGKIETEFRTFKMEVLAGENQLETEVKESKCIFKFNFAEVYWNSRLQAEHDRLVGLFSPKDIICDMFAGVGPFALPAAKKGCTVYANDLNPRSYHYLVRNATDNNVKSKIHAFNMDGREFVRELVLRHNPPVLFNHVVMNLPASAVQFIDIFRELGSSITSNPTIHCYGFSNAPNPRVDIVKQVADVLGKEPLDTQVFEVRDVSPKKMMMCISFKLPQFGEGESSKRKLEEQQPEDTTDKRVKQEEDKTKAKK